MGSVLELRTFHSSQTVSCATSCWWFCCMANICFDLLSVLKSTPEALYRTACVGGSLREELVSYFLPLDEAVASIAVFVVVSGADGRVETLLEPDE